MQDTMPGATAPIGAAAAHGRLRDWLREGLRAALLLPPRVPAAEPFPLHLVVLVLAVSLLDLLVRRLAIPGDAYFNLSGWLTPWSMVPLIAALGWWLFAAARTRAGQPGVAAWYLLWSVAVWPVVIASGLWEAAWYRGWVPRPVFESGFVAWLLPIVLWGWEIALAARIGRALGLPRKSTGLLVLGLLAVFMFSSTQFSDERAWIAARTDKDGEGPARFVLRQETFETQQAVWADAVQKLQPQRPGVRDVYGIVFAPYGSEEVFRRESTLAATVLRERFDADGRVLQLLNHMETTDTLPWATPLNLQRALEAVAQKMDRDEDVLVLYMTSHGASNFKLSSHFWPLDVPDLTPQQLRAALDQAGIRNRVLMVSACYSGGWIEPLADESTLVMTAADATHTSYGCGRRSELTFFGRALWDEELKKTHSFEAAFAAAVPVIRKREEDAKKPDGFSNPQIRMGAAIRPVLSELAARLDSPAPADGAGAVRVP
jgi:hypothetical protein